MLQRVQVRAADPAGEALDEHLTGTRLGDGHVGDDQLPVADDGGPHYLISISMKTISRAVSFTTSCSTPAFRK
jgi:hypothetical protein